jgi:hypothetical protein
MSTTSLVRDLMKNHLARVNADDGQLVKFPLEYFRRLKKLRLILNRQYESHDFTTRLLSEQVDLNRPEVQRIFKLKRWSATPSIVPEIKFIAFNDRHKDEDEEGWNYKVNWM